MRPFRLGLPLAFVACLAAPALAIAAGSSIRTVQAEGVAVAQASLSGQDKPMLNTFRLRYTDGDHRVAGVGVTTKPDEVKGLLYDSVDNDRIALNARLIETSSALSVHTATQTCTGACTVPIEKRTGSGVRLYLAGFVFRRTDLTDANVKKIHLMPNKDETAYQVDFRDDSTFEYEVTIQYGWFAAGSGGDGSQLLIGHRLWGKTNSVIKMTKSSSSSASVLRGFSFQFLNGDHFLKDIAVEQDSKRQYKVRFNDKNYDDPVMAQLDIVFLG